MAKKDSLPKYSDFIESVKKDGYAPLYLFIGEEDFLIDECISKIIDDLLVKDTRAFNLDIVYGSKVEAKDVIAHAASFPMMSERRVVVIWEFDKLISDINSKELISNYISKPLNSTCLVMVCETADFRKKPFTDIKKAGAVFEFNRLYDNQIPAWISKRLEKYEISADSEACRLIHAYIGNSLRTINNEIEKLAIYLGDRKKGTPEDVVKVVGASREFTIFDLQKEIGKKNLKGALKIIKRMLETGEAPQLIIIMLTRYFTLLWKIQDLLNQNKNETEILSAVKIHQFYLKDYISAVKNFSPIQIEAAFDILLETDLKLKTTSPDHYHLMEMLVYSLINKYQISE